MTPYLPQAVRKQIVEYRRVVRLAPLASTITFARNPKCILPRQTS